MVLITLSILTFQINCAQARPRLSRCKHLSCPSILAKPVFQRVAASIQFCKLYAYVHQVSFRWSRGISTWHPIRLSATFDNNPYPKMPMKLCRSCSGLTRLSPIFAVFILPLTSAIAAPPSQPGKPFETINNSQLTLNWLASEDDNQVAGYNIYQNDQYIATVNHTQFQRNINLEQDQQFYVIAFDNPNPGETRAFSARSNILTLSASSNPIAPTSSVPTAPVSLLATRTSDSTVHLNWAASLDDQGVAGYNVYRDNQYISTVVNPRLNDIGLISGITYEYYVVAFDEPRQFSARSMPVIAPVTGSSGSANPPNGEEPQVNPDPPGNQPDLQSPAVVTGLQAQTMNNTVELSWPAGNDNIAVAGYNVYRNGQYLTTVFTPAFADQAAAVDAETNYQVAAFDEARNFSPLSAAVFPDAGNSVLGNPPTLLNPSAEPTPSPNPSDPFGALLEQDTENVIFDGAPTRPKNLRVELVSNDWAELSWAPANDDEQVVEYKIYRSDGHVYSVRADQTDPAGGTQDEINKYWRTTSFIDCNYTRFLDRVHECGIYGPAPGDTFDYQVSAVDNNGFESVLSNSVNIVYHLESNAPIPFYDDFYKLSDDHFAQEHDLSQVDYFIDEFELVFADEFNTPEIDQNKWHTSLTWADTRIINGEQQYFVNTQNNTNIAYDPFNLTGSSLIIEAIPTPEELVEFLPPVCDEADPFGTERCAFLSGALSSHDRFGITYGYVEGRMKTGGTPGMLSSFYLYHRYPGQGLNLHAPEIDIVEYLGENPFGDEDAFQTYHFADVTDGTIRSAPTMQHKNPSGELYSEDFHTFGVLWEPQLVIWYIDGKEIKRLSGPLVGRQQMNIVTYLVSGSAWAPTPDRNADIFPLQFEIDYIRAYQRPVFVGNGLYPE